MLIFVIIQADMAVAVVDEVEGEEEVVGEVLRITGMVTAMTVGECVASDCPLYFDDHSTLLPLCPFSLTAVLPRCSHHVLFYDSL